jgi:hypothetical protein
MASTYVNDLRLNEMATGDASGSWGTVTNTNLELIGEAFSYGTETIGDADSTLTIADGAADAARSFYLKITSSVDLTTTRIVTLAPNTVSKVWMIENATTGSQVITIKQGSGATINVPNGQVKMISTDGAGSGGAVLDLLVDVDLTGTTTLVNLDVSGAVDIAGDLTLSAGGDGALRFTAASSVKVLDNNAAALVFEEADNAYMTFVTTDGSEAVKFDKALDINAATQIDATVTVGVDDTGYDVKFFGATTGKSLLWDESADSLIVTGTTTLVGTTNLDAVDIDGATQIDATVTVGVDDTGYDVKFFGATAGAYMLWDESADDLILGGAAGLSVNSTALVTGVLTTTAATVFNGGFAANAASTITTADNGVQLNLISTDSGSLNGPRFVMQRTGSAASSGDLLGRMEFYGSDDGGNATEYARIGVNAFDATGGSEDGAYFVSTRINNVTTNRMYMPPSETVFNDESAVVDFRVESDTITHALFVAGSSGNVGIGASNPAAPLSVYNALNPYASFADAANYLNVGVITSNYGLINSSLPISFQISDTERMRIDGIGAVTMPLQPAFSVNNAPTTQANIAINTVVTITWSGERFDQNADFDLGANSFTAPVTGKYQFNLVIRLESVDIDADYYIISIVTSNVEYKYIFDPVFASDPAYFSVNLSVLADLDASDTAYTTIYQSGGAAQTDITGDATYTYFTGYLVA